MTQVLSFRDQLLDRQNTTVIRNAVTGPFELSPDLDEARRFLSMLDKDAAAFTFQTFSDASDAPNGLTGVLHGSLDQYAEELTKLNRQGAGVFVTVNRTNLAGRKSSDIVRVRALFADLDGAPLEPVVEGSIPPDLVVQSSVGKWHCYWFVGDCPLDRFKGTQQAIAVRFGSDPAVNDLSRVLRLPGFFHRKAKPFMVSIDDDFTATSSHPRKYDDFMSAMGLARSGTPVSRDPLVEAKATDPILLAIYAAGLYERDMGNGKHSIRCPFEHEHSDSRPPGDGDTAYFLPHTNGYERATVNCLHSHCSERTQPEYLKAIGYDARSEGREKTRKIGEGEYDPLPEVMTSEQMCKRFVFLSDGSRVFDKERPTHVHALSDCYNLMAASVEPIPTGKFNQDGSAKKRMVSSLRKWLEDAKKREDAVGTTFKPGVGIYTSDPNGRPCVNLWNGYLRKRYNGTGSAEIFVEHVRWLFRDRADDFLDWLAHLEQYPGVLPHTAWLHVSHFPGTGRNAIASILARVFAGYTATSVDLIHMLESGFNERISRKVLAVVDEIREGGAGQWKHDEELKKMITAHTRTVNVKYGRQSVEFNVCRWLLFSNHETAISLRGDDRRFDVVINPECPKPPEYYKRLYGAIDSDEFIGAVADYLGKRDLSKFNPGRHAFLGEDKLTVLGATRSDELQDLIEFTAIYPLELSTAIRLSQEAGLDPSGHDRRFKHIVAEAGWRKLGRKRVGNQRHNLYVKATAWGKWKDAQYGYEVQLPESDGGKAELTMP